MLLQGNLRSIETAAKPRPGAQGLLRRLIAMPITIKGSYRASRCRMHWPDRRGRARRGRGCPTNASGTAMASAVPTMASSAPTRAVRKMVSSAVGGVFALISYNGRLCMSYNGRLCMVPEAHVNSYGLAVKACSC